MCPLEDVRILDLSWNSRRHCSTNSSQYPLFLYEASNPCYRMRDILCAQRETSSFFFRYEGAMVRDTPQIKSGVSFFD